MGCWAEGGEEGEGDFGELGLDLGVHLRAGGDVWDGVGLLVLVMDGLECRGVLRGRTLELAEERRERRWP